jgi:hypothetical protein
MKFIQPDWPAPAGIQAYTTLRDSWGKRDFPQIANQPWQPPTAQEEQNLRNLLPLPTGPIWLAQTHGITVVEANIHNKGKNADASYTDQPHQVCIVLTADCLPILICNQAGTHVAAIHAGWRGLAGGIVEATVQTLPCPANDLLVWLGPGIGAQKFEVGKDVYDAFTLSDPAASSAFAPCAEQKWLADLYTLAKIRLHKQGVTHIYGGNFCTYSQTEWFFSYRRDQGKSGRMASMIWIN